MLYNNIGTQLDFSLNLCCPSPRPDVPINNESDSDFLTFKSKKVSVTIIFIAYNVYCNSVRGIPLQIELTEDEGVAVHVAQLEDEVVDLPRDQVGERTLLVRRADRVHPGDARVEQRLFQPEGGQDCL